jgi:hypothetical protein
VAARYGLTVQAGPFKGMKYVKITPNHAFVPKLLGFYEQELHPCLEEVIRRGYDKIVNVGSAEGYYAIGLGRHFPKAKICAYDIELQEQQLCRELARLNGLADRLQMEGWCEPEGLQGQIEGRTLIIVDCEGGEMAVLDPARAPKLAEADLLIEIHDFDGTTRVGSAMRERFAATHDLTVIRSVPRRVEDHPLVAFLPSESGRQLAVMEREGMQDWFFLRSRARA